MYRRSIVRLMNSPGAKNAASEMAKAAGATTTTRTPLSEPRAVTPEEAPFVEPYKETNKESMMPWKGWFGRLIKDRLGEDRYKQFRKLVFFMPDDYYDLLQQPTPDMKVKLSDKDPTLESQFRTPSPGSQTQPMNVPRIEGDPYQNTYYNRDTGRRGADKAVQQLQLELMDPDDPRVEELKAQIDEGPDSSPGNKGRFATGPTDFDASGLRATMSTSHVATEASLDAHMPNHLPTPDWADKQDEIVAWYEERDLPVPCGGTGWGTVPREGRIARW
eukprot:CAMPEP_0118706204 /NCGR_PEP_ID=MMETSP0800-20121206/20402_1 /TAXON_ID=210618 ORGANISM="Striatella unipunctata, Strain CCMP2910" /NCGR_SAMPLE_ID=MMETSP0800 /ASSEMBLY_ACC=CAM_ASM_000638 /LENGTH=274 /DNA_ID=CAMNT_0006608661 /DNA_START=144 /DNA_END=965 /DNA_ORIENTATION=-